MNTPPSPFNPTALPGTHPPDSIWQALADSALPQDSALPYLLHAAQCRSCAELLAAATASYAAPPPETEEEATFLAQLATSTPATQLALAEKLHTAPKPEQDQLQPTFTLPRPRRRFAFWTTLTAAALTLCATTIFLVRALRPPSDTQLVALAYNRYRTSELRLPDSAAVPLASPTRGPDTHQFESIELLKARTRAQEEFERNPNDPRVRQFRGEVYIVAHDPEAARRDFEMAEALNPNLPRLKFDLATAYFELAESAPLNYAYAIDYFSQYLNEVHNSDPVALFDLGLCYERNSVNYEAIKNFEAALALERDPAWRAEIQRHLAKLKAQAALDLSPEQLEATLTPQHFLTLTSEAPGQYELYLDAATRKWLPNRQLTPLAEAATPPTPVPDPNLEPALQKLAQWGLNHHDRWLTDILRQPQTPANLRATQTLAQAITASAAGKADDALATSALAITQFRAANNHPGQLRAQAEHIYALQRLGMNKECRAEATALLSERSLQSDSWLHVRGMLEEDVSNVNLGKLEDDSQQTARAIDEATRYQLPLERLRAIGFSLTSSIEQNNLSGAWESATTNLRNAMFLLGSAQRKHSMLVQLRLIANKLRLPWTQRAIDAENAKESLKTGSSLVAAFALEDLAMDQVRLGLQNEAAKTFSQADNHIQQNQQVKPNTFFAAQWRTDRSELLALQNPPAVALSSIQQDEQFYAKTNDFPTRQLFYTQYANLLLQVGRPEQSLQVAWNAITLAEQALSRVKSSSERQNWITLSAPAYQLLVLGYLESGHPDLALRSWEWYKTATVRTIRFPPKLTPISTSDTLYPPLNNLRHEGLTLVVALVKDKYVVWSIPNRTDETITSALVPSTPATVQAKARTLARLCSDPTTSLSDVNLLSKILFQDLFAPFQAQLTSASSVTIELDPSLSSLPVGVLRDRDQPLGATHPLIYLADFWSLTRPEQRVDSATASPSLLVLREPNSIPSPKITSDYDETMSIKSIFPQATIGTAKFLRLNQGIQIATNPRVERELESAEIVHYVGHGLSEDRTQATESISGFDSHPITPGLLHGQRLAVLAACHTVAERESETKDVPSFARVLLNAGDQNVLASLWEIDSQKTSSLMQLFYLGLSHHLTFSQALQHAQQILQSNPESQHPYYWSAFQLIGT